MRCGYLRFDDHSCERCRNCPHAYRRRRIRRSRIKGQGRKKKSTRVMGMMNDHAYHASCCFTLHFRSLTRSPALPHHNTNLFSPQPFIHILSFPRSLDSPFNGDPGISVLDSIIDMHPHILLSFCRTLFFLSTVATPNYNHTVTVHM